jgi:hypothetical protein
MGATLIRGKCIRVFGNAICGGLWALISKLNEPKDGPHQNTYLGRLVLQREPTNHHKSYFRIHGKYFLWINVEPLHVQAVVHTAFIGVAVDCVLFHESSYWQTFPNASKCKDIILWAQLSAKPGISWALWYPLSNLPLIFIQNFPRRLYLSLTIHVLRG